MANAIDLVVGEAAFTQINDLLLKLGEVDTKLGTLATSFSNLGKGATNPSDSAALKTLTDNNAKLNEEILKLSKSYDTLNEKLKKLTESGVSRGKGITEETIAQRELNAQTTLNIKATTDAVGAYAKLDAQHKLAVKSAQDLAVQHNRQGKDYEAAKLRANELGKQLKVIDTDIGKHTRNVGNYSSSWNGLGNSINQLTREAPAFANSVQTGFMALSNNIPILTDELGVLIQKNKDLQKDGKPTESILKTVAGAFFSWQTAISLGVTILTVYGAKIWELATALTGVEKSQKALSEVNATASKDASKEIGTLDLLYRTVNDVSLSIDQRKRAVDKLQELYPSYFKNIKDENILNGEAKNTYLDLRDAIMASARAKAISAKLEESAAGRIEKENVINTKLEESRKELIKVQKSTSDNYDILIAGGMGAGEETKIRVDKKRRLQDIYIDIKKHKQDLADLTVEGLKEDSFFLKEQEKLEKASAKLTYDRTHLKEEAKPKTDKSAEEASKAEEERLKKHYETLLSDAERQKEIDKDILESFNGGIVEKSMLSAKFAADEVAIANLVFEEKKRLAKGDVELIRQATNEKKTAVENAGQEDIKRVSSFYSKYFKEVEKSIPKEIDSKIPGMFTKEQMKEAEDAEKERLAKQKKSLEEQAAYLQSFADEFASKSGFPETFKMLSGQIEGFGEKTGVTFNAIAESAQEMFNMINESSQASFDAEYARLDAQKNEAIKNAGDSTVAKEKIEADYEKKKKEIDKRKFESDKKISMVNIVIDTAQAVVATLAKGAGFFSSPLAMIVAAMGAAQLGMVAAQQFPAYAEGTDNHKGGLMLVNDGAGSNFQEKVILPSGKVIRPQGRNVLMDAPKGTKVLNHEQQLFEMLQSNNISMSSQQASGLTYDEMNEIFQNNFANIKTQNTIFDKNGFQSYVRNGNSITRSNSNRSQAIGISV